MAENELEQMQSDIPEIIAGQIEAISTLEAEVNKSEKSADDALEYFTGEMKRYEDKEFWLFSYLKVKYILKDTQTAVEKVISALQPIVNAQKKSFEFQKQLAETSKYLFELGCSNIAMNRIAVRTIEEKLTEESQEEFSELARQELMNVVRQLKAQEDILKKLDFMESKVKDIDSRFKEDIQKQLDFLKSKVKDNDFSLNKLKKSIKELCI